MVTCLFNSRIGLQFVASIAMLVVVTSCATHTHRFVLYPLGNPEDFGDYGVPLSNWFLETIIDSVVIDDPNRVSEIENQLQALTSSTNCNPSKLLLVFWSVRDDIELRRGAVTSLGRIVYGGHCSSDNERSLNIILRCLSDSTADSLRIYVKHPW